MSKILMALNKVRELREKEVGFSAREDSSADEVHRANENEEEYIGTAFNSHLMMISILLIMGICSIYINFKTLSELKKTKAITAIVVEVVNLQKSDLKDLAEQKTLEVAAVDQLNQQLKEMKEDILSKANGADQLEIDYSILRVQFDDLALTNKALIENFIGLSSEVGQLKESNYKLFTTIEKISVDNEESFPIQ